MSIMQSLDFLHKNIDVWTTKKNEVYRQVIVESQQKVRNVCNELAVVCEQIRDIKSLIEESPMVAGTVAQSPISIGRIAAKNMYEEVADKK